MYYTYVTAACPKCGKALFFKITKLMGFIRVTSGLGPNFVICSSCHTKVMTSNKEWQQMSFAGQLWYLVLSIFYGVMIGFMSSTTIGVASERIFARTLSTETAALFVVAPITLIIFLIQMIRIQTSLERTESNQGSEKVINFWDWETNLQFYGMSWIILAVLASIPFLFF
jgi:branched-subunit amino acid ABC-type transport system permease component